MTSGGPKLIMIFSGKRKSGKDYVTDVLHHRIGTDKCSMLRLSAPLKEQYAKENTLDYSKLLGTTEYKEKFRIDMIKWGEERRNKDPGFFCEKISKGPGSQAPIWIISDARRSTDIEWFQKQYPGRVMAIRVQTQDPVRSMRGWVFTPGVDDGESECGLDKGVKWDYVLNNNGHDKDLESGLKTLESIIRKSLE